MLVVKGLVGGIPNNGMVWRGIAWRVVVRRRGGSNDFKLVSFGMISEAGLPESKSG